MGGKGKPDGSLGCGSLGDEPLRGRSLGSFSSFKSLGGGSLSLGGGIVSIGCVNKRVFDSRGWLVATQESE